MKTITICSSASFYKHVIEIKAELEKLGYAVLVPKNAEVMAKSGDYDTSHYKTWFNDPADYHKKADYMTTHFKEVAKGDVTLIVNDEKHGVAGYIGGNVLMEMAVAFYLGKPIFVLNELPANSPYEEELKGMGCQILNGDLAKLAS